MDIENLENLDTSKESPSMKQYRSDLQRALELSKQQCYIQNEE